MQGRSSRESLGPKNTVEKLTWPSGRGPWSLPFLLVSVAKSLTLKILHHRLLRDDCFGAYPQGGVGL